MNSEKGKSKKRTKEREKTDIEILFAFVASGAVHAMWKKPDQKIGIEILFAFVASGVVHVMWKKPDQ